MKISELIDKLREFDSDEEVALGFTGEEFDAGTVELVDETRTSRLFGEPEPVHCRWVRIGP